MNKFAKRLVLAFSMLMAIVLLDGWSSPLTIGKAPPMTNGVGSNENKVMIFQSPNCGCCESYKDYLKEQGLQVQITYTEDIASLEDRYQIPQNMKSCHIAITEDYFVEGHVPIQAINKLKEEKPAIDGIALPGMLPGSPGMPRQKAEALIIYALSDGAVSEFISISE